MHRLGVHVRRLVNAGYKASADACEQICRIYVRVLVKQQASAMPTCVLLQVGIVRQTETAAIKKAEGSRGTFDRKLNAVYTSATLEASMNDACMHACVLSLHIPVCAASVPCPPADGPLPVCSTLTCT